MFLQYHKTSLMTAIIVWKETLSGDIQSVLEHSLLVTLYTATPGHLHVHGIVSKQGNKKTTEVDKDALYNDSWLQMWIYYQVAWQIHRTDHSWMRNIRTTSMYTDICSLWSKTTTFCRWSNKSYNVYERQLHLLTDPGLLVCWHLVQSTE